MFKFQIIVFFHQAGTSHTQPEGHTIAKFKTLEAAQKSARKMNEAKPHNSYFACAI